MQYDVTYKGPPICCRFFYCSKQWGEDLVKIDEELSEYVATAVSSPVDIGTYLSHVQTYPCETRKHQFLLLSSVSNYHWYKWTSGTKRKKGAVAHHMHLLSDPEANEEPGKYIRKYVPTSPRNRIMYYLLNMENEDTDDIYPSVKQLFQLDNPHTGEDTTYDYSDDFKPPPKKKRKHTARLVSGNAKKICQEAGVEMSTILNCANPRRSLYTIFQEELITQGVIRWRLHESETDVCVMSDINSTTGCLMPNSFVHVTCRTRSNGEVLLKCSCSIYNLIQRAAHQDIELLPGEEGILDDELTCMHCRFFRDYLLHCYQRLIGQNTALTQGLAKVQESLQHMNDPIQLLGSVLPQGTTKFSVKGDEHGSYATVHFNFVQRKCYAKCTEGMCAAKLQNKKNLAKSISLKEKRNLCTHLQTIYSHIDHVKSFFPEFFKEDDITEEGFQYGEYPEGQEMLNMAGQDQDTNNEDANVGGGVQGNFNLDTGLWEYKAKSKHIPRDMMDPELIVQTQIRNDFVRARNFDPETGLYGAYHLIPFPHDADGNPKPCQCGAQFPDTLGTQVQSGTTTLYTRMGAVHCICFDVPCNAGRCRLTYLDAAQEEGIFFFTNQTAVAEEIGWDFVNRVMKSKISFTAFCTDMTRMYQTNNIMSGPFMSTPTFVSWFFGWLAAFKIDFRKEVDPWCSHNPKILACDGTHIGVSLRNMRLEKPVTRPDVDTVLKPMHKRYDRVLITNREAREHLRYLTKKKLGKYIKPKDVLTVEEQGRRSLYVLTHIAQIGHDPLTDFIQHFVQETQDDEILSAMAKVLYMLCGDAAMSSAVPFACHDLLLYCCQNIDNLPALIEHQLEDVRRYNAEISQLLKMSRVHGCTEITAPFVDYLVRKIQDVHADNRPNPSAQRMAGTYNPRSGTAYYFTPSGDRVRDMPSYDISGNSRRKYYDDDPQVEEACRKLYPEVSFGGFGYLFLWFCPIHGHCYGMHLIAGSEGRKDPFASIFKYMEKAPEHIFYDFACQLSEYCLNREPEFFKMTRFWHDLFHSIGHVCGINFKSGRIEGLEGINTEICEQVNSFLQCVKYTASHLSQDHFMFFLQFFLHLMNKEKTSKFRKQATVAVAGQL